MPFLSTLKLTDEPGRLTALRRYGVLDTDPEADFEDVVDLAKAVFQVSCVAISFIDDRRQWLGASRGLGVTEIPRSMSLCHHTIQQPGTLAVDDLTRDPRFASNPFVLGEPGLRCYLATPLRSPDGYNLGTLCAMDGAARQFGPSDIAMMERLARLVMSHLELRTLARRDGLTGAMTRRSFEAELQRATQGDRGHRRMALILLDIDHFKSVNDRFGHLAGDDVLREVARTLQERLGPGDALGRLGGEEFALLLRRAEPDRARSVAEEILGAVRDLDLPVGQVTASCGVAVWPPGRATHRDWIGAADTALYGAKASGRDRLCLAGPTDLLGC
ncbi:sensor domain-containing diguanylate cyclase [Rubellimicrobium roseum]|nr:sensor domain-containing diguanylate cyclase [Rubellimicrobium roseum]